MAELYRQKLFTALNIGNNANRVNAAMWSIENRLGGIDSRGDVLSISTADNIDGIEKTKKHLNSICGMITRLLPSTDIEDELQSIKCDKPFIEYDTNQSSLICADKIPVETKDLSVLATPYINYTPKVTVQVSVKMMDIETFQANSLNDILDAMSYELQGISSENGEPHGFTSEFLEALIANRLQAAKNCLSMLGRDADINSMESIVRDVENGLSGDYGLLGKHIDDNTIKMKMVRRSWAIG